jgi:hypothetical protein
VGLTCSRKDEIEQVWIPRKNNIFVCQLTLI